jgi:hypothetical protein
MPLLCIRRTIMACKCMLFVLSGCCGVPELISGVGEVAAGVQQASAWCVLEGVLGGWEYMFGSGAAHIDVQFFEHTICFGTIFGPV